MILSPLAADNAAGVIARFLKSRGVDRIFSPCGRHIMPNWMRADDEGNRIGKARACAGAMAHFFANGKTVDAFRIDLPRPPVVAWLCRSCLLTYSISGAYKGELR